MLDFVHAVCFTGHRVIAHTDIAARLDATIESLIMLESNPTLAVALYGIRRWAYDRRLLLSNDTGNAQGEKLRGLGQAPRSYLLGNANPFQPVFKKYDELSPYLRPISYGISPFFMDFLNGHINGFY